MASKTLKAVDATAEVVEENISKAADVVEEVASETADVIEETLDTLERIPKLALNGTTKKQQIIILSAVAVVSAAAGGAAVYFVLRKKLEAKYAEIATEEIAQAREQYALIRKDGYSSPEEAVRELIDESAVAEAKAVADEAGYSQGSEETPAEVAPVMEINDEEQAEVKVSNILVNNAPVDPDEWDFDVEVAKREEDPTAPYILEHDEFFNNESGYEQSSLTFFEADGVLVDARDDTISDTDSLVGDDNLMKFGHGSRDANILYVRNDKMTVEFEIVKSKGSYTEEVLGLEHSVRHSARQVGSSPRRFRPDHDG